LDYYTQYDHVFVSFHGPTGIITNDICILTP